MANADTPFGLRPVGHLYGQDWSTKLETFYCPVGDSVAIYKGDPVKQNGTADSTGRWLEVAQADGGDTTVIGVAWAFSTVSQIAADPTDHERDYRPASTAMYIKVITDPYVIYEIQEDSDGGSIAYASVGLACDVTDGTGSSTTGLSGVELDSSEVDTTGQLKILGLAHRDDGSNDIGTNAIWRVVINEHYYRLDAGA